MKRALWLTLLLAGPAGAFEATGEVRLAAGGRSGSAAFDDGHVVGPAVNLTRREDGAWAGDIRGRNVALRFAGGRLSAPNFDLLVESSGGSTALRGIVFGRRYGLTSGPSGLRGKAGACSVELKPNEDGLLTGSIGCLGKRKAPVVAQGSLKLLGQASDPAPPLAQFALALIAALP